jgi:hypothetical protein
MQMKSSIQKPSAVGKGSVISSAFKNSTTLQVDLKGKNLGDSHANEIVKCLKAQSILKSLDLS